MTIVTVVEGKIPLSKISEFEKSYTVAKREPLPPSFITSVLLKNAKTPETYRIQTIWGSREALEKMRSSTQTPKAIELFQKVGTKPNVEVYETIDNIP